MVISLCSLYHCSACNVDFEICSICDLSVWFEEVSFSASKWVPICSISLVDLHVFDPPEGYGDYGRHSLFIMWWCPNVCVMIMFEVCSWWWMPPIFPIGIIGEWVHFHLRWTRYVRPWKEDTLYLFWTLRISSLCIYCSFPSYPLSQFINHYTYCLQ